METRCTMWRQCLSNTIWNVKDFFFFFCPWGSLAWIKWKNWTLLKIWFYHSIISTFTYKFQISFSLWLKMKKSCIRTFSNPFVARTKSQWGWIHFLETMHVKLEVDFFLFLFSNWLSFPHIYVTMFFFSQCLSIYRSIFASYNLYT